MGFFITMFIVWAILAIVFLIVEINTVQQVGFAAMFGSIIAIAVHAKYSDLIWPEFVAFGISWILSWLVLYFIIFKNKRFIHDSEDGYLDFINQEYKTISGNEKGFGRIVIGDKNFRFKSEDKIKKGEVVIVKSIKGATFIVNKKIGE
ncbi:NfeD family protein [Mycoplasma marinum]|uniref:Uncharacterized protein n=1 Tax=Mycoplasma marinum TaxID=1937190 RepID=A0A4R0XUJ3_9MOLU|nr:NfeD family protein [Mycoplasma marinum]TCG11359.1 hypothetical protein C4B24_02295 [Mycoplasma marinum]